MNNYLNNYSFIDSDRTLNRKMNNILNKIEKVRKQRDVSQMTFDFGIPKRFGTKITVVDPKGNKKMICFIPYSKSREIYTFLQIPKELAESYFDILKYSISSLVKTK